MSFQCCGFNIVLQYMFTHGAYCLSCCANYRNISKLEIIFLCGLVYSYWCYQRSLSILIILCFLFVIMPSYLCGNKYLYGNYRHCSIQQNGTDSLLRQAVFSIRVSKRYLKFKNHLAFVLTTSFKNDLRFCNEVRDYMTSVSMLSECSLIQAMLLFLCFLFCLPHFINQTSVYKLEQ